MSFFGKLWSKIMNKKKLRPKFKILVLALVEWIILIRMKITELSSFKTLGEVWSGSLIIFILEKPLKDLHIASGHAKLYTIRYNVTNITMYAYHNVTKRYAYCNVTIYAYYNAYCNVTIVNISKLSVIDLIAVKLVMLT